MKPRLALLLLTFFLGAVVSDGEELRRLENETLENFARRNGPPQSELAHAVIETEAWGRQKTVIALPPDVALGRIEAVVRGGFGPGVKVESQSGGGPFYLLGDFNGDGYSDVAVLVNIEGARADLKGYGVRYINVDPYSRRNGLQIDPLSHDSHNCLGIAIVHGTAAGWEAAHPAGRFMVYECFSSFRLIRKGQRIRRGGGSVGRTPVPKGDSILLDLETGGTALTYWDGKTYRGFGIRGGD